MVDIKKHNRIAWDRECQLSNPATVKYPPEEIDSAKKGNYRISLTGLRNIPSNWFEPLLGKRALCIALAGGQQAPLIAAAGANVVSLDNSPSQLQSDKLVADQHGLQLKTVLGDMREMENLVKGPFDIAFMGLGIQFIPDPSPVWKGVSNLLERGSRFVGAFVNPVQYLFEWPAYSNGEFLVKYALPYSDIESISEQERIQMFHRNDPLEFGHTLEQLIGGLTAAGFTIDGFLEDVANDDPLSRHIASYYAFYATKL